MTDLKYKIKNIAGGMVLVIATTYAVRESSELYIMIPLFFLGWIILLNWNN